MLSTLIIRIRCCRRKVFRVLLCAALSLVSTIAAAEQQRLLLGVVPQQSAKVLANNWTPLVRYLSEETGIKIKFATAKDIPTFEQRLSNKKYQLAYMNPYHFVHFHDEAGYQALAKQKDKQIKGILVTRKDSSVNALADLQDEILAFPAPAAFAASILTRSSLRQQGVEIDTRYVSSHDSVYLNVAKGIFPAGGGVLRTFQLAPEAIKNQLKVFHTTEGFTPHAFAVSEDVSTDTAEIILQALLLLHKSEEGQAILQRVNIKAFEAANNADWDDVRKLNLSQLFSPQ